MPPNDLCIVLRLEYYTAEELAEIVTRSAARLGIEVDPSGAAEIGRRIAEKAKGLGISEVAFDRSGHKFHGRVKALAEAAREAGLKF